MGSARCKYQQIETAGRQLKDIMDTILLGLQGKAFQLSDIIYRFLSDKYESIVGTPITHVQVEGFHPLFFAQILKKHREQFRTVEYSRSRIENPTTGTIDHLHAEITSSIAVRLASQSGFSGYPLELLRISAHLHDSDRSYPATMVQGEQAVRNDPVAYQELKERHVRNSADIAMGLARVCLNEGFYFPVGYLKDLEYMILRHEKGGIRGRAGMVENPSNIDPDLDLDDLTDLLTDADSLAYFDANILTNWGESNRNVQALSNKVHFMYDRMSERGQKEFHYTILESKGHILGPVACEDEDVAAIRCILLSECL